MQCKLRFPAAAYDFNQFTQYFPRPGSSLSQISFLVLLMMMAMMLVMVLMIIMHYRTKWRSISSRSMFPAPAPPRRF